MKELFDEWKKMVPEFLQNYGKVACAGILICVSGVAIFLIASLTTPHDLQVSFLDIGQGDSILIQTPSGKTMIIDGGPSDRVLFKMGEKLSYFDRVIDVMVETHPDADHVTGLIPVLEQYEVKNIVISPADGHTGIFDDVSKHVKDEHANIHVAQTGDTIDFHDGVIATILYPPKNYRIKKNDTNDASVSIVLSYENETFLLTGDLPSVEEPQLIRAGLHKHVTVYKAGHHGSKYSSGEQLLSYITPEYSVISAGKNNKYGHPNPEAIERLQKYSKEIISTIDKGTISFATDGRTMEVTTDR